MGADLICFIAKGPNKFKGADVKKAIKRAEEIIKFAGIVHAMLDRRAQSLSGQAVPKLTDAEETFLETCLKDPRLRSFNDQEQFSDIIECERYMERLSECSAKEEVDKFVDWWVNGGGRDTASRPDPDDRKQQIVVCGDMSWGDTPDGYGYTRMREAYWFDIPTILGVR